MNFLTKNYYGRCLLSYFTLRIPVKSQLSKLQGQPLRWIHLGKSVYHLFNKCGGELSTNMITLL